MATKRGGGIWMWVTVGVLALAVLYGIAPLFNQAGAIGPATSATADEVPGEPNAFLRYVIDNPREFYGRTVTVTGEIDDIVAPTAFTIGPGGLLLVSSAPASATPDLSESQTVQVTGTVRRFDLVELERETGADLQDELFAGWEGRPAIVASSVQVPAAR